LHTYTLTITKEDFWLEFKSTDKTIIEKELGVWITSAANLLEQTLPEKPAKKEPAPEKVELGKIILDTPKAVPIDLTPFMSIEPIETKKEDFPTVDKPQSYKISDETKEILQRAIHKPLPSMSERLKPEPVKVQPVEHTPQTITQVTTPVAAPIEEPTPVIQEPQDFTTIFNQKIAQENNSTDRFAQLLSLSNIHNKSDCLIACAYHLVERENFERFTLKQINTLSRALLDEAIDHETLKEALEKRFIKIVPDYTGIATTMEYTLTEQGAQYFKDVIIEE